jgi:hypothetical protein
MPKSRGRRALSPAAIVFALLVLATVGAFAYAQRVKRDPLLIDRTTIGVADDNNAFTPNGDCVNDKIRLRFRTTTSNDANVQIVKPGGALVRTLAREEFLKRYHFHTFYWDGALEKGGVALPGRYKLRVSLLGEDRVLTLPGTIHVHEAAKKPGCVEGSAEKTVPKTKSKGGAG